MNEKSIPKKIRARQHEIVEQFLAALDRHLADVAAGRATEMLEIRDLADLMHIHPRHLTNTVKFVTGRSPCDFFEEKIMAIAVRRLEETDESISQIAFDLTFDPSNFTKFFKRFAGLTPRQYRENHRLGRRAEKN